MYIVAVFLGLSQGIIGVMRYYEVAPLKIIRASNGTFSYASSTPLTLGSFVEISVGKSSLTGVVLAETTKPNYTTKEVSQVLAIPPLPRQLVTTILWMSEYYSTHIATVLQTVLPRGIVKKRRASKKTVPNLQRDRTHFLLNRDQSAALEVITKATPGTVVLHGITGSGKTAIYIEHAKQVLASGKSVIMLVPEIALTSQLVAEFQQHFSDIVLTHSRQTEAERHLCWQQVAESTTPTVVIGPRSALFLPLQSVGAIIIDEAHEPSFKQDKAPRYSALRVAGILAKEHNCVVIQGSATPLVSEYYLAKHYKRPIITLATKARENTVDPKVTVVDMTKKASFVRHRFFSDNMIDAMTTTLERGEQVLVFHNRRGSASTTLCESCGWSATCPRCFVPYTLHADIHQLRCHICDTRERVPTSCPVCGSTDIIHKGIGTKLIESELLKLFPNYTIARFDGDSADDKTVESQYQALYDGDIKIIIGTQVIAKGLDLPHLRTVGVVQADSGLSLPDFAASERTFQLLAQVVGRVGRSAHATEVIVQSYQPGAPAVQYGIAQNYTDFYTDTLAERKRGHFPPFSYLLKLTCVYKTEAAAIRNAKLLASQLHRDFSDVSILGPTPSFYERQRDTYRWQITIKSAKRSRLLDIITVLPSRGWQYDIDPASLL